MSGTPPRGGVTRGAEPAARLRPRPGPRRPVATTPGRVISRSMPAGGSAIFVRRGTGRAPLPVAAARCRSIRTVSSAGAGPVSPGRSAGGAAGSRTGADRRRRPTFVQFTGVRAHGATPAPHP